MHRESSLHRISVVQDMEKYTTNIATITSFNGPTMLALPEIPLIPCIIPSVGEVSSGAENKTEAAEDRMDGKFYFS